MAVRASANGGILQHNSGLDPVTRKQMSLYHAALTLKDDERFRRLYGILKWRPWLEEAARRVLGGFDSGDTVPDLPGDFVSLSHMEASRSVGVVSRLFEFMRGDKGGSDGESCLTALCGPGGVAPQEAVALGQLERAVLEAAILMVLIPIYTAGSREVLGYGGRRIARGIRGIFASGEPYRWVIYKRLVVPPGILGRRAFMRVMRETIADRRFLRMLGWLLASSDADGCGSRRGPGIDWDPSGELEPFLCDIYLTAFDRWFSGRFHRLAPAARERNKKHGVPCARMLRCGRDLLIFVDGTAGQARALSQEVKSFLDREMGVVSEDASSILDLTSSELDFLGFRIRCTCSPGEKCPEIQPSPEAIGAYKAEVRDLTGSHRESSFSPEIVVLRINWLIRGWRSYFGRTGQGWELSWLDRWTRKRLYGFLRRRHSGISMAELLRRYPAGGRDALLAQGDKARGPGIPVPGTEGRVFLESVTGDPDFDDDVCIDAEAELPGCGVSMCAPVAAFPMRYWAEPFVQDGRLNPPRQVFSEMVREVILARDGPRCRKCGGTRELGVYDLRTGRPPGDVFEDIRRLDQLAMICTSCRCGQR